MSSAVHTAWIAGQAISPAVCYCQSVCMHLQMRAHSLYKVKRRVKSATGNRDGLAENSAKYGGCLLPYVTEALPTFKRFLTTSEMDVPQLMSFRQNLKGRVQNSSLEAGFLESSCHRFDLADLLCQALGTPLLPCHQQICKPSFGLHCSNDP